MNTLRTSGRVLCRHMGQEVQRPIVSVTGSRARNRTDGTKELLRCGPSRGCYKTIITISA